ncbi:MAG: hypothetical protein GXO98_07545, partial [Nitrospirae bacterium]|nr:hypothetical protein [Nitrospirota bacterium]
MFYKWEYLYYHFFYLRPKTEIDFIQKRYLVYGDDDSANIASAYSELFPDKVRAKINEADLICKHIFDLLGSGSKKLSPEGPGYQPIDWHSDFKNDFHWNPQTLYSHVRYRNIRGVEVKVPWELSRFQHLNILGQAYTLTKHRKYAEEFSNQIADWIKNNPIGLGVNWRCTMDVAIRAVNWLVTMEYFHNEDTFSQDFLKEFYLSIYEHGKFIRNHLEYSPKLTGNHYLADIAGLFFIAVYCPFFRESKKWQEFTLNELSQEIEKQVYPDGCNFEASVSYHRFVLEMLFYSELLGKRAGIEFPENYKNKIRKMFEFSLYCVKPNGMAPQIGDNDNGRFLIFCKKPVLEHKYLLTLAAMHYKDSQFKLSEFDFDEEAFWVFGPSGKKSWDDLPYREKPLNSKAFPDAGWYIMRDENNYCFISCGPNGQHGNGGHAHNDKLSFELTLNGQDVIVDPGTYVYLPYPEKRNRFRSTAYHNTIAFDNREQSKISDNLFSLPDRVKIIKAELTGTNDKIIFQGEIQYADITHKRTITRDKKPGTWQITDTFSY